MNSLASMYLTGLGVKTDLESALLWFSAAARQGDVVAKEQARLLTQRIATERGS
jgi:TPR repeat protein